jgi:D-alanine-D-alanine ligase
MKTRVIVVMGGPSGEHEVSVASGRMVADALRSGYEVAALVIGRDGRWALKAPEDVPALAPRPQDTSLAPAETRQTIAGIQHLVDADVVFLALHGRFGEDGTLQGLLETIGLPYTGSGPLASALAMHKAKAKQLFVLHGLQVPRGILVTADQLRGDLDGVVRRALDQVGLPAVVKPNQGGSSLGAGLARGADELRAALVEAAWQDASVLVEEQLAGTEITCAVVETLDGVPEPLPLIEIVPHRGVFFDFASKYDSGGADEIVPARVSPEETRLLQETAVRAHQALGCEGFSRTDMFLTDRGPVVLEVNTIPGMTPNSLLPKAAAAAGIPFPDLVDRLVKLAQARHVRHRPIG